MAKRIIQSNNRGFKGVWIPAHIWLDENLTVQEILFLVEIDSLDNSNKGCFASNKHFADFFGLSKSRVSEVISSLNNKEYISIKYELEGKEVKKRYIKVFDKANRGIRDIEQGYSENTTGSNTSFSNTNINKDILSSKHDTAPYSKIIHYLNDQTGKKYKVTDKWKKLIQARMNEGQTYEDFIKVIDTKVKQWKNDEKMSQYLRPQTLFGNKFDEYLNEYTQPANNNREQEFEEAQRKLREAYEQ